MSRATTTDAEIVWIRSTSSGRSLTAYHDDRDCHLAESGRWIDAEHAESMGLERCPECAGEEFRARGGDTNWDPTQVEGVARLMRWAYGGA